MAVLNSFCVDAGVKTFSEFSSIKYLSSFKSYTVIDTDAGLKMSSTNHSFTKSTVVKDKATKEIPNKDKIFFIIERDKTNAIPNNSLFQFNSIVLYVIFEDY